MNGYERESEFTHRHDDVECDSALSRKGGKSYMRILPVSVRDVMHIRVGNKKSSLYAMQSQCRG